MVGLGSAGETAFIFRRILLTAGHENWIEQRSKQDSNNYLIPQFCLQLLRYNYPANGKEREKTHRKLFEIPSWGKKGENM